MIEEIHTTDAQPTENNSKVITTTVSTTNETEAALLQKAADIVDSATAPRSIVDKLKSRKFWASLAGLVCSIIGMIGFSISDQNIGVIASAIIGFGSIVSYIVAEGRIDATSIQQLLMLAQEIINALGKNDITPVTTTTTTTTTVTTTENEVPPAEAYSPNVAATPPENEPNNNDHYAM